jgi:isopentenyl diphosphate isomerase/L-lactate dehydrogenase-like FMN-dependent dehydrogenase
VTPLNVEDYARLAAAALEPGALGYYAGGAGDERTLEDNVAAWSRLALRARVLVDVSAVSTATTVLGTPVAMPVLVAPVAIQKLAHPDGEAGMARAAATAGTIMCLSTIASSTPAEVAAAAPPAPRWFQLYAFRDAGVTRALLEAARAAHFEAVVLTVDAPVPARRERDLRGGFTIPAHVRVPSMEAATGVASGVTIPQLFSLVSPTLTWADLDVLVAEAGLPVLLKGVMTGEDAVLACEHGVAGVVVSNHGGRQLDGVPATADVLAEVVDAVAGRVEVLVDGGIRRGTDVLKALALGARAVLVGRPPLWGLAAGGEAGAAHVLELLQAEIAVSLALLGCPTPADVHAGHVGRLLV